MTTEEGISSRTETDLKIFTIMFSSSNSHNNATETVEFQLVKALLITEEYRPFWLDNTQVDNLFPERAQRLTSRGRLI